MAERLVTLDEIRAAARRVAGIAVRTPLVDAAFPGLSGWGTRKRIRLKAEGLQPMGAFKIRGAANKILQLTPEELSRGVITYSSGNHAQAVAWAARQVGAKAVIVMPSNAPAIKRAGTLALGAEVVEVGVASSERLAKAEELVRQHGYVLVRPYDDLDVITGQATCGLEIADEWPEVDLVLAPISGGGLLGGVAAAVRQMLPNARVWGVEPELAADAAESLRSGVIHTWEAADVSRTIADGLRTQSVGIKNFAHLQAFVEGIVTVTEDEIRAAMRALVAATHLVPEPSGAVPVAALLFHGHQLPAYRNAAAVVSGGNVDPALLAEVLSGRF
jgi:threonine dehydratase